MNRNCRIRINLPKIVHETIDGETIILNLDNGNYYSLVGIGAEVWGFIEHSATANDITERLHADYEGAKKDIEAVVDKFVSELIQEGLTFADEVEYPDGSIFFKAETQTGPKGNRLKFDAPILSKYSDMKDLLLLDPIHETNETGWPESKPSK
jgi:hypothetical protein